MIRLREWESIRRKPGAKENKGIIYSYSVLDICPSSALPRCRAQQEKIPSLTPGLSDSLWIWFMLGSRREPLSHSLVTKILRGTQNVSELEKSGSCELWAPLCCTGSRGGRPGQNSPDAHGTWLSISRQPMVIFAVCCYHDLIFKGRKLGPRKENQCKSMVELQCRMSCLVIPVYLLTWSEHLEWPCPLLESQATKLSSW